MSDQMPSDTVSVTANITANLKVHIAALRSEFQKNEPVYALNWFNTHWGWLYNFYNLLAAPSVLKVGGVPFFKARVEQVLHGESAACRAVLLIVCYPNIEHFKTMLQSRYFQLVSILRGIAVKEFTFGFSTRTDADTKDNQNLKSIQRIDQRGVYAIHHYQIDDANNQLTEKVAKVATSFDVELAFASTVSARLYTQQGQKPTSVVDTIMDGCLILQANTNSDIEALIKSEDYQVIIASTQNSFIATLKRVF